MRAGAGAAAAAAAGSLGAVAAAAAKLALGPGGEAAGGPVRKGTGGAGRPELPSGRQGWRCALAAAEGKERAGSAPGAPRGCPGLQGQGGGLGEWSRDSARGSPALQG